MLKNESIYPLCKFKENPPILTKLSGRSFLFYFSSYCSFSRFTFIIKLLLLSAIKFAADCLLLLLLLLLKHYNLYKVLACSTTFFQTSLFCATSFQLRMFILFISSITSSFQRVLGLPIGLLDMGFHLLIFCTILSSAMCTTWPNQFNLCFLITQLYFFLLIYHLFLD